MRDVHERVDVFAPCFSPTMSQLTIMKGFVSLEAVKNRHIFLFSLDLAHQFFGSSMMSLKFWNTMFKSAFFSETAHNESYQRVPEIVVLCGNADPSVISSFHPHGHIWNPASTYAWQR